MSIEVATRLAERYELTGELGHGGMADVYRATDAVLGREVAVKVLHTSAGESDRGRFLDEGRILAGLSHPGLVTLLDVGTHDDQPFLVMELVEGQTLADLAGSPMDPVEVARIGAELADALDAAHSAGVVHRDVKPGNVLVRDDGRVALFDFGIAKLVGELQQHTAPGLSVGTAAYLAPEQVLGEEVGPAADVYALGLVLLELLTGTRVYAGPPLEAAVARLNRPAELPEWLPVGWLRLLRQMTATEVPLRPTAAVAAGELRDLQAGGVAEATMVDVLADTASWPVVTPPRARFSKRVLIAGTVAVLALLLVAGTLLVSRPGDTPKAEAEPIPKIAPSLQVLLEDLHAALEPLASSTFGTTLDRVDRALLDRRYADAGEQLRTLARRLRAADGPEDDVRRALASTQALLVALPIPDREPRVVPNEPVKQAPAKEPPSGPSKDKHPGKGHGKGKGNKR